MVEFSPPRLITWSIAGRMSAGQRRSAQDLAPECSKFVVDSARDAAGNPLASQANVVTDTAGTDTVSQGTGSDSRRVVSGSVGEAEGADVETPLVCAVCREVKPWTLSCIHTFTGSGATDLAGAPSFERPCETPQAAEWSCRARRDVPGPAAEQPAHRCRLYASADFRALSVTTADAWPIVTPPSTRRWLDTKDRRGSTKSDPIHYGPDDLEFLSKHGIGRRGEARPKRREVAGHENVFDDGSIDIGWASKVRHPRWKDRLEKHSEADYRYLRRWARSVQFHRNEWPQKEPAPRLPKSWRRFRPDEDLLTDEARERWWIDRELYRAGRRASRYAENLWESVLADDGVDERHVGTDPSGWASAVGVRKADRLLAHKLARRRVESHLERYLNRHRTPAEEAVSMLAPAIRRAAGAHRGTPQFWTTLPQHLAVDLARRAPQAYAALAELDAEGALDVPKNLTSALERALQRLAGVWVKRTLADDLKAVLQRRPGDGLRILEAAAATGNGIRLTTFRKNRAVSLRLR